MRVPAFITRERTLQKDGNCYNYLWVVPINVRGSDKSMRIFKVISVKFFAALLALSLLTGPSALFAAASSSKQLAKGIELYNAQNYDDAMDYFIDVLVNGSRSEVDEANRYINLIHNRIGGIQDPVEVDINFKEGETRRLEPGQETAVFGRPMAAEKAPNGK